MGAQLSAVGLALASRAGSRLAATLGMPAGRDTLLGLVRSRPEPQFATPAQRLNSECIELPRHLHDHQETSFALLYVGGDGCWEVLSREPMLRSRVYRRLPFKPVPRDQVEDRRLTGAAGPLLRIALGGAWQSDNGD